MLVVELDADVECPLERIGETVAGAFLRVPVLELGESEKVGAGKVNPHHLPGVANLGCLKPEERRIAKCSQCCSHSICRTALDRKRLDSGRFRTSDPPHGTS